MVISAVLCWLPAAAAASTIWANWSSPTSTQSTASFSDGRSVVLTAPDLSSVGPMSPSAVPNVPGLPGGDRPPNAVFFTGTPHPTTVGVGDVLMSLDLTGFPVDAETIIGFEDVFYDYRIELLDISLNPLSLIGLSVSQYNLFFSTGEIADYDVLLDATTGALTVNEVHDASAGSTYRHSGLVLFGSLPTDTAFIQLVSSASQGTEGLRVAFGGSPIPEPGTGVLVACGLLALGAIDRSRVATRNK